MTKAISTMVGTVAKRAIVRNLIRRTAGVPIDATKLPKPSPWQVPIPWDEAKVQIAENLNMFIAVGCAVRKFRPVADPYVRLVYKGRAFELSVGRRMPGVMGNLWVESEDARAVAIRMPQIIQIVNTFTKGAKGLGGNGTVLRSALFATLAPKFTSKWADALAMGIAETMLELGGVPVVMTIAEQEAVVTEG